MSPTDTLIFEKKKSEDEWTHIDSFNMKGFDLDDYGHTSSEIIRNFHDKVKDKYKDKCGKIEFEFKQCGPIVNITGDCKPKDYSDKIKKLQHDIIKETSGLLKNEYKDITKIENDFFSEYIKNGITIHVRYGIKDCEPIKVASGKPVPPKDCKYEALYKIIINGPCDPSDAKLSDIYYHYQDQINKNIPKKYKEVNIIDVVKPSIDDKVSTDILKEGKGIIFHGGSKIGGSSFGKRKSIIKKKNPKKKVIRKRFSKC